MASKKFVLFLAVSLVVLGVATPGAFGQSCPYNTLQLGVCADLLKLVDATVNVGSASTQPCCSLLNGLADLDAAACLCTAAKVNLLGINLNLGVDLSLILNSCGKNLPAGYVC
ncbi:hypothetical protein C2845_PM03G18850 [Panicum miliaceum]|uniref:Bifunctional inhibitor/plant lipid transfer protein/seed storage helical domain-containing protein n=1 Tax=Panicum miliaceum TaxID=4540 RepID=A0A3L6T7F5_PANMI|nr:hypothetical protein C2845_PM03G18850 [Panicum miliaceum]